MPLVASLRGCSGNGHLLGKGRGGGEEAAQGDEPCVFCFHCSFEFEQPVFSECPSSIEPPMFRRPSYGKLKSIN